MKIYAYYIQDVSPDALRSSTITGAYSLGRTPCKTNLSHQEREHGWCGTTNDRSMTALGVVDLDADDAQDAIVRMLDDDAAIVDMDAIRNWAESDDAEDYSVPLNTEQVSESATWDAESDDNWWPVPRDGWANVYAEDNATAVVDGLNIAPDREVVRGALDAAGIRYDDCGWENYDAGGYSCARAINVRSADYDRAVAAICAAAVIEND